MRVSRNLLRVGPPMLLTTVLAGAWILSSLREARRDPRLEGVSFPSARVLTLLLSHLDPGHPLQAGDFRVVGPRGTWVPLGLGRERRPVAITPGGVARSRGMLHLLLPGPLVPGETVEVGLRGRSLVRLPFPGPTGVGQVAVNQVGYRPELPKLALVGGYLGDLGPLPVVDRTFRVLRIEAPDDPGAASLPATPGPTVPRPGSPGDRSREVLRGRLRLREPGDPASGSDVYEADFTSLREAGFYRVEVAELAPSPPFRIGPEVYQGVHRLLGRAFYHRRNSALVPPFVDPGHARRGVDPDLDGVFHPSVARTPLGDDEPPGGSHRVRGGWFDAGDYGAYVPNAAPVWGAFSLALDLGRPGLFEDGEWGIPESGNGIPDLLDELAWGTRWALDMQALDGGVYRSLASGTWDRGLPEEVRRPRWVYPRTTRATAQFAAMAAIAARLLRDQDPGLAARSLGAARRAWGFLGTHRDWPPEGEVYRNPDWQPGGGAYGAGSALPAKLWAAAELFRTTGEGSFLEACRELWPQVDLDLAQAPESTFPAWALVRALPRGADPDLARGAREALLGAARLRLEWMGVSAYGLPRHPHPPFTGWHSASTTVIAALPLLQGEFLGGGEAMLWAAFETPHPQLGRNPLGVSFLVGVGARSPRDPMDRISLGDGVPDPLPGMPVPGPTWWLPDFREPYRSVNASWYPPGKPPVEEFFESAYPALRRYLDDHRLIPMAEGTVRELGFAVVAYGLLREGEAGLRSRQGG